MGAGCCGKEYEGKSYTGYGGVLIRRRRGNQVVPLERLPLPQIKKNYLYLPNRFLDSDGHISSVGTSGLENTSNSCFINAALQCIANAAPLTDYFLSGVYLEEINARNVLGTRGELAEAYAELLEVMWFNAHECILPRRLLDLIDIHANQFADGHQHDAHEFLACFLDKLHEDLNRSPRKIVSALVQSKEEKEERKAARAWQQYLTKNSSVIVDLFQGQLKSTVTCMVCRYVSTTFDTFMYLSVPLPKTDRPVTLVDCLIEFTKNEILPDNTWVCPMCKKEVRAVKKIDIWKVPPILLIHLKRFYYEKSSYGKLINRVDYPVTGLDITQYVSGPQKEPPVYDLFAKIDHAGDMAAGHYVAYAKNARNRLWHYFDDEQVHQVDESEVLSEQAYLLFYCKVSISQYRRQSSKMPSLWPHVLSRTESFDSEKQDQSNSTASGERESRRDRKKPLGVIREDPSL